jgi:general secretion pathway protein G
MVYRADGRQLRMRKARGFTLLELLVVVAIIGLLVAYVGPRYLSQIGKSETAAARAQIEALAKALDAFRLDTGHYPSAAQGLGALRERPSGEAKWNGPYLQKDVPTDPWGKHYVYRMPGAKGDFEVVSYGRDGAPGGSGDNADVVY